MDLAAADIVADGDRAVQCARAEAAGNRDRGLDRHVRREGILAGLEDFTEDEEGPIGFDLDRDMRLAHETLPQHVGNALSELVGGQAARGDQADQRHLDLAAGVDDVRIGQAVLAEHHHAQAVAGVEQIGILWRRRERRESRPVCRGPISIKTPAPRHGLHTARRHSHKQAPGRRRSSARRAAALREQPLRKAVRSVRHKSVPVERV